MLVLSRRASEKIVFQNLGITVEVLQVGRRIAKLGISAPDSVRVLRTEVTDSSQPVVGRPDAAAKLHRVRNRLNRIMLRLHLLHRQLETGTLEAGTSQEVPQVLAELLRELAKIESGGAAATPVSATDHNRPIRLLVVDDDANERELLAGLLDLYGFQVDTAVDGADALQYLSTHQVPDCVLLDLDMPRVDGHRTILSIRSDSRYRSTRVFAVSGMEPCDASTPAGLKGFDAWFPKPLDPSRLLKAITARTPSVTHEVA